MPSIVSSTSQPSLLPPLHLLPAGAGLTSSTPNIKGLQQAGGSSLCWQLKTLCEGKMELTLPWVRINQFLVSPVGRLSFLGKLEREAGA